ncbi:ESCRT-II complex subunit VPS25 [Microdochium nivale]|nr:ESCRT-II complex subunit VPS25 [Microdochium nivale]
MSSSTPPTPPPPAPTAASGKKPFEFPREYSFPPFFTRQANLATLHSQRETWSAFVLDYCRHHRIFRLSLGSAVSSNNANLNSDATGDNNSTGATTAAGDGTGSGAGYNVQELFHNRRIDRRLSLADARDVLEHMRKEGRAEPAGGTSTTALSGAGAGGSESGDVWWIYWRTPEEWAAMIEGYVDETAQRGTVLTLYELAEGEGTRGKEFHGLHPDLLQKALQTLVKRSKAQIFGHEDSQGVKFF